MSPLHGELAVGMIVGIGTFVEGHDDVRAEVLLNRNGLFRREAMRRTVDVTLEGHAVIVDLAGLRQREDLEAARVGQHGMRPLHEFVQAAHLRHQLIAGAQVKMIGVAQHERGVDILEMLGRERLDRCLRAHRCEDRREEVAVRGGKWPVRARLFLEVIWNSNIQWIIPVSLTLHFGVHPENAAIPPPPAEAGA